ncbi:MAG TPA: fatty acid-binding protein DegV, partial [Lachnospiraceae bacterium]|nr:fatty acid-binding protein DegV [Lachnospiraceae bacterium]
MRLRDLFGIVNDKKRDIQERLMLLTTLIALVALFAVFIGGFFVGETLGGEIVIGSAIVIFALIVYFSARYNKLRLGANICSVIIVFAVIPFTFFTSGGIIGGAPVWIILSAIFITMTTQGRIRTVLWCLETVVTCACYYAAYNYPFLVTPHTLRTGYMDSLMSVAVVGSMGSMMIGFSIRAYREENIRSEERRKEIDELSRAQNQFFSNMSHEIRTPINSILSLNEMILREDTSEEVREDARNIQAASKLLLHIINDILDMSSIESGKMEIRPVVYNVRALLSDIIGMIEIRAQEKDLSLLINVDPSLPLELYGDEIKIKQILINLLTNAVKYTKEGSVSLSVGIEEREGNRVQISFSVADTGIGIKKDNLYNLFTAFKRVDTDKNRYIEGTGLGLSIVKELTELMDGNVKVNSVYMQGSTFVVTIPQDSVSDKIVGDFNMLNIRERNSAPYVKSFEAPEARILVVDDNAMNLMVVQKLLRDTKALVDTAESGETALQKTLAEKYDLILMDHLMPEMDGIETLHRIREQIGGQCKETKVCALTANAGSDKQSMYYKEGFDGYLLKPVSGSELENEIIRLLPPELVKLLNTDTKKAAEAQFWTKDSQRKLPVIISTESVCDLPEDMIKSHGIAVLPFHVITESGVFLDGVETDVRELAGLIGHSDDIRSKAPDADEYEAFFSGLLKRANNVIHVTIAQSVGNGYSAASEAARSFDNVTVVDSGHLSSAMGMMVLEAAGMVHDEQPPERIVEALNDLRKRVHTSFLVEDTAYLIRSGRIDPLYGRLARAFMLNPRPIFTMRGSRLRLGGVCFG